MYVLRGTSEVPRRMSEKFNACEQCHSDKLRTVMLLWCQHYVSSTNPNLLAN